MRAQRATTLHLHAHAVHATYMLLHLHAHALRRVTLGSVALRYRTSPYLALPFDVLH